MLPTPSAPHCFRRDVRGLNSSAGLGVRDLSSLLDWSWAPLDLEVPLSRGHLSGLKTVNPCHFM